MYELTTTKFHCLKIVNKDTGEEYGCFNRFEKIQLTELINTMNGKDEVLVQSSESVKSTTYLSVTCLQSWMSTSATTMTATSTIPNAPTAGIIVNAAATPVVRTGQANLNFNFFFSFPFFTCYNRATMPI